MKKYSFLLLPLVVLISVSIYSGSKLLSYYLESEREEAEVEKIQEIVKVTNKNEPQISYDEKIKMAFSELTDINDEFVGWIKIEGTQIDYPVLKAKDNSFYLDRNIYKEYNKYGSIFMDMNNIMEPRSSNLIMYGHHMKDGKMFGDLMKYVDEDFYREHKYIEFNTLSDIAKYEIISVFKTSVYGSMSNEFSYYSYMDFGDEGEFISYLREIKRLGLYDIESDAKFGDSLITLSTCEYTLENGRLVIVARRLGGIN
jgi:sortase B